MILTFLLIIIYAFWSFIISLFPTGSLSFPFSDSLQTVANYAFAFNSVLPLDELLTCFVVYMGVELTILVFKGFEWVYVKFWGSR